MSPSMRRIHVITIVEPPHQAVRFSAAPLEQSHMIIRPSNTNITRVIKGLRVNDLARCERPSSSSFSSPCPMRRIK